MDLDRALTQVELVGDYLVGPAFPQRLHNRSLACSEHASERDRKSTRLNSSHGYISYAVFCLKKKNICLLRELGSLELQLSRSVRAKPLALLEMGRLQRLDQIGDLLNSLRIAANRDGSPGGIV